MASEIQLHVLATEYAAAKASGCVWPAHQACEAMEESKWGTTDCYLKANNPFGQKQRALTNAAMEFSSLVLPTWEVVNGHTEHISAAFISFPSRAVAYEQRMKTLRRLQGMYPEYAAALAATSGEEFVTQVSKRWSTDPNRARTVLAIYSAHADILQG